MKSYDMDTKQTGERRLVWGVDYMFTNYSFKHIDFHKQTLFCYPSGNILKQNTILF